MNAASPSTRQGVFFALTGFTFWGLFPLYLKQLETLSPQEVMLHRSVWSLVFLLGVLAVLRRWRWLRESLSDPRLLALTLLCAVLLSGNWLLYVVAIQAGRVVEASLGYFINPLLNVLLGVVVLRERLQRAQKIAVALAAVGVAWLTWRTGGLPWMALSLAASFAAYGLLRKTSRLGPMEGLTLETLLLAPLLVPWLLALTFQDNGALARGDWALTAWVLAAGPLTAIPLMCFAAGARRLPLATMGILQYLSPTLQLLCGIFAFGETFDADRAIAFAFIWAGLAVYSIHTAWRLHSRASASP